MSFGWSAGDVFQAGKCLYSIIKALNDSTGSSKDYVDLMLELDTLHRTLNQVEAIFKTYENRAVPSQLPQSTINAMGYTASRCKTILEEFLFTIRHYQGRLAGKKGWRESWRKIGWGLLAGDEVEKVRAKLGAHSQCLMLLVDSASLTCAEQRSAEIVQKQDESQNLWHVLLAAADTCLTVDSLEIYRGVRNIEEALRSSTLQPALQSFGRKPFKLVYENKRLTLPVELFASLEILREFLGTRFDLEKHPGPLDAYLTIKEFSGYYPDTVSSIEIYGRRTSVGQTSVGITFFGTPKHVEEGVLIPFLDLSFKPGSNPMLLAEL